MSSQNRILINGDNQKGKKPEATTKHHSQVVNANPRPLSLSNVRRSFFHRFMVSESRQRNTYQRDSLNAEVPPTVVGKGKEIAKFFSYLSLFSDFRDEALLVLLSALMAHTKPPAEAFPISLGFPPPWWPTTKASWWTLLNFPIDSRDPPYTNPHKLSKVNKVAVLTSLIKHNTPKVIHQIINQHAFLEDYVTNKEWHILRVVLDMEDEHLRRSKQLPDRRTVNIDDTAMAPLSIEQTERLNSQFPLKESTYGASSSTNFSGIQMNPSFGGMTSSSFIGSNELINTASVANRGTKKSPENLMDIMPLRVTRMNRRNGIALTLPESTEGENSMTPHEAAANSEQNYNFGTETAQVVPPHVDEFQQQRSEEMGVNMGFVEHQNAGHEPNSLMLLLTTMRDNMQTNTGCDNGFGELSQVIQNPASSSTFLKEDIRAVGVDIDCSYYLTGFDIGNSQYDQLDNKFHGNNANSAMDASLHQESGVPWNSLPVEMSLHDFIACIERDGIEFDQNEDQSQIQQEAGCRQSNWVGDASGDSIDQWLDNLPEIDEDTVSPIVEEKIQEWKILL